MHEHIWFNNNSNVHFYNLRHLYDDSNYSSVVSRLVTSNCFYIANACAHILIHIKSTCWKSLSIVYSKYCWSSNPVSYSQNPFSFKGFFCCADKCAVILYIIARYAYTISNLFNRFYHECRILSADDQIMKARIVLVDAVQKVISDSMLLLGIECPGEM